MNTKLFLLHLKKKIMKKTLLILFLVQSLISFGQVNYNQKNIQSNNSNKINKLDHSNHLKSTILVNSNIKDFCNVYGKIKIVDSFEDFRVKIVDSFEDIRIIEVNSFSDSEGRWEIVDSFEDYRIKLVDSFEDFTIKLVDSFEGCQ
jgi:hypothetical protein